MSGLEGVKDVDIEIVWGPPWNPSMMTKAGKEFPASDNSVAGRFHGADHLNDLQTADFGGDASQLIQIRQKQVRSK